MRYIYISLFLLCTAQVFAQRDTTIISIRTEDAGYEAEQMLEARDLVYGFDRPAHSALKWNLATLAPISAYYTSGLEKPWYQWPLYLSLAYEQKLGPQFSVEASAFMSLRNRKLTNDTVWPSGFGAGLGVRYFFKKYQSRELHHLSGNYLELRGNYVLARKADRFEENVSGREISLNYGMQRRLFNNGYFDFGIGLSSDLDNRLGSDAYEPNLYFSNYVRIGLARFSPSSKSAAAPYCSALRCFEESRQMFKINLFQALRFSLVEKYGFGSFSPSISYERKIGQSAFSIDVEANGSLNYSNYSLDTIFGHLNTYTLGGALEPRWYFTQKRRIAMGKSGNNLSGIYAGLHAGYLYSKSDYNNDNNTQFFNSSGSTSHQTGLAPIIGLQYRFLKHGYVDFNFGIGYGAGWNKSTYTSIWPIIDPDGTVHPAFSTFTNKSTENGAYFTSGLRLGWAF